VAVAPRWLNGKPDKNHLSGEAAAMPVSLPQMLYKVIQIDADQVHDY